MVFHRITTYSKNCNVNLFIKNKYLNKGTRVSPHSTFAGEIQKEEIVSVADYYSGKSIFVTGGTGFLGKIYIQRLLYTCPNINKIYMLVRASSKEAAEHRVMQMVESSTQLFNKLKEERPEDLGKLVPIVGDLSASNLGIHPDEEKLLREEVSVIVNSAATINLNETLQDAVKVNVTGTQNLLALAKRIKKLQAFIHISTLFCASTPGTDVIEEIVNPPPINPNDIKNTLENYGHMRVPPKKVLGDYRNTYLFTKALSESMIQLNHAELPTAIIRPSLIGSSYIEPYKGWIDIMNIHSFLMYAVAVGHIRVLKIDEKTIWDFIPADYVANTMILAALKCKRSKDIDVYNSASSSVNPVNISKAVSTFMSDFLNSKSNKVPFPFVLYLKSDILFRLLNPILQITPAYISDLGCVLTGQKPKSVQYYRKFMELSNNINFYLGCSWRAKADRVRSLTSTLNEEDRRNFPCNPNDIEWSKYLQKYSEGIRNFVLKNRKK